MVLQTSVTTTTMDKARNAKKRPRLSNNNSVRNARMRPNPSILSSTSQSQESLDLEDPVSIQIPEHIAKKIQSKICDKESTESSKLHELQQQLDASLRKVKEMEALRHGDLKKSALVQKELHELKKKTGANQRKPKTPRGLPPPTSVNPPKQQRKQDDEWEERPGVDEYPRVAKGKYGQCRPGCCQRCHNLRMKNRKHKGPCDKQTREAAHARFKQKEANKAENFRNYNRKNDVRTYKADACKYCVDEDAHPKHAIHDSDQCYRKPGGILDQKHIKGNKARTAEVIRLAKAAKQKSADKHPKGTTKVNRKTVKFTGVSKVSVAQTNPTINTKRPVAASRASIAQPLLPSKNVHGEQPPPPSGRSPGERRQITYVLPHDRRWSDYQNHLMPSRYLRNEVAVETPLSKDEIDALIDDDTRINDERERQQVRHYYECVEGTNRLIKMRDDKVTPHPLEFERIYKPSEPSYVNIDPGAPNLRWKQAQLRVSRDAQSEIAKYKHDYDIAINSAYTKTQDAQERYKIIMQHKSKFVHVKYHYCKFLSDMYGYGGDIDIRKSIMFDAIHARWERNRDIQGYHFDKLREMCKKFRWPGFKYMTLPLKHAPFKLIFPNVKVFTDSHHWDLLHSRFTLMKDYTSPHFGNDHDRLEAFIITVIVVELHKARIKEDSEARRREQVQEQLERAKQAKALQQQQKEEEEKRRKVRARKTEIRRAKARANEEAEEAKRAEELAAKQQLDEHEEVKARRERKQADAERKAKVIAQPKQISERSVEPETTTKLGCATAATTVANTNERNGRVKRTATPERNRTTNNTAKANTNSTQEESDIADDDKMGTLLDNLKRSIRNKKQQARRRSKKQDEADAREVEQYGNQITRESAQQLYQIYNDELSTLKTLRKSNRSKDKPKLKADRVLSDQIREIETEQAKLRKLHPKILPVETTEPVETNNEHPKETESQFTRQNPCSPK